MAIKHVFFDLDHTLWDFETNSESAYAACFKDYIIPVNFQEFMSIYKPINFDYWKLYREDKVTKDDLKYRRLKDTFDALNYTIDDQLILQLGIDYLSYLPDFNKLFEGAKELLDYLVIKYKLHIITNGFQEVQNKKLHKACIIDYFDQVITSESVGANKPNPKVFNYALSKAKAQPHESIMIGDNIEADVNGALNVGMSAIHFNSNGTPNKKTIITVTSMLELKKYL